MLKTKAIVLHSVPYSDSGSVVHLYTLAEGRIAVFVRSKSKRSAIRPPFLQPFSVIDIVLEKKPTATMYYVKECVPSIIFASVWQNPAKSAVAIFFAEVLYRAVKEQHSDSQMFDFAIESIIFLDNSQRGIMNFPMLFLLKLSGFLGFSPNLEKYEQNTFFDLKNGNISKEKPLHPFFLSEAETSDFVQLMRLKYETMHLLNLSKKQQESILEQILLYLHLHLPEFGTIKSIDMLKAIL